MSQLLSMRAEFTTAARMGIANRQHEFTQRNFLRYILAHKLVITWTHLHIWYKRGVYGTFHAISKKHLHRYCSEFEFRWDTRDLDDGERVVSAIKGSEGKRLTYYEPTKKTGWFCTWKVNNKTIIQNLALYKINKALCFLSYVSHIFGE